MVFSKTKSISTTLIFVLVGTITNLILKSVGISLVTRLFRNIGLMPSMTTGLLIKAFSLIAIFFLPPSYSFFTYLLFLLSVIETIGNTFYVTGANALFFQVVGSGQKTGSTTAFIAILQTISGLLATIVGVWLAISNAFLYSFIVGSGVLVISTLPLVGIKTVDFPRVSFWRNLKNISPSMFLANINPEHEFKVTAVPLIIFLLYSSLQISIWVSAAVAATSIILSYIAGRFKDRNQSPIIWIALLSGILAWLAYGFVKTPIEFLVVGVVVGFVSEIFYVGRESRMSKELCADDNIFGGTLAIEFARTIGKLIGISVLIVVYLLVKDIPQIILIFGGLFLIPIAWYGAGKQS